MKEKDCIEDFIEGEESVEFFQDYHNFSELKSSKVVKETKKEITDSIPSNDDLEELVDDRGYLTTVGRMKFVDIVVEFCQVLSGKRLYTYQLDAAKNVVREFLLNDAEEICLLFSRQSGKTEVLSVVIAGLLVIIEQLAKVGAIKDLEMYKEGLWIGYFAGTTYQVETLFDRTCGILENSVACEVLQELDEKKKTRGKVLKIGKSFIFAKTAAKQSRVESKTYHMIICVGKDTIVSTPTIPVKISELQQGDSILGYNFFNNSVIEDRVKKVWCNGVRDVWELTTTDGSKFLLTNNHKVWTSMGWKTVNDLLFIDKYTINLYTLDSQLNKEVYYDERSINNRNSYGRWVYSKTSRKRKSKINYTPFFKTGRLCYVEIRNIKRHLYISSKKSREQGLWERDNKVQYSKFTFNYEIPETLLWGKWENNNSRMFKHYGYRKFFSLVYGRWRIKWKFKNYGIINSQVLNFRGRVTDDMVKKEMEYRYSNGYGQESSETFSKIYCGKSKQVERINATSYNSINGIQTMELDSNSNLQYMQEGIHSYTEVKMGSMLNKMQGQAPYLYGKQSEEITGKSLQTKGIKTSKIKSITYKGKEEVWDLTSNTHTFFANGVLVHNCDEAQDVDAQMIRKCYSGDTLLPSSNGEYYSIQEIVESKLPVWGYSNPPRLFSKEKVEYHFNGEQDLYKISYSDGTNLKVTLNHRHPLFPDFKIKETHQLSYGDSHIQLTKDGLKELFIEDIEYIGKGKTYCVTIPTEDHLIIVDNGKISSNSISPMLSSTAGLFIKSGTPNTKVCELYEACLRTKRRNLEFEDLCPTSEKSYHNKIEVLRREIEKTRKQLKALEYVNTKAEIVLYKRKLEYYKKMQNDLEVVKTNWKNRETPRKFYFEVPWQIPAKENPRYKRYVDKEKVRLGEHSDDFMMSYALTWMISRGMFITDKVLSMCGLPSNDMVMNTSQALKIVSLGDILDYWNLSKTVAGIDWGKTNDSTVMSVFYVDWDNPIQLIEDSDMVFFNKYLIYWLELLGDDYEDQYPQIEDVMQRFNVGRVVMDANGSGDPIYDRFVHKFENKVDIWGIKTNSATVMNDLIKHWGSEISKRRYWYPASEDAQETREYKMFQVQMKGWYKTWKNGYLTCHHDPNDKEAHDDYCFSSLFGVWGATKRLDNELEFGKSIFPQKKSSQNTPGRRSRPIRSWRR